MKSNTRFKRNPFISRVAALFLIIPLILQMKWPVAVAETTSLIGSASSTVNVYFGDTEIYDGMKIEPTGYLHARYSFTATRNELSGVEDTVILPERLNAAYAMSEPIIGIDSKGNAIRVGTMTIDEKLDVKVSFLDLLDSADSEISNDEDSTLAVETDDGTVILDNTESGDAENTNGELAASENTESGDVENTNGELAAFEDTESGSVEKDAVGEISEAKDIEQGSEQLYYMFQPKSSLLSVAGIAGDSGQIPGSEEVEANGVPAQAAANQGLAPAEIEPTEVITMEFDVPVIIDATRLTANNNGSYYVELESGGQKVTVNITAEDVPVATPSVATPPVAAAPAVAIAPRNATAVGAFATPAVTVTDWTLKIKNQNDNNYNLLADNTTVKSSDSLRLTYNFKMSIEQARDIKADMNSIAYYKVPIPNGLKIPTSYPDEPMVVTVSDGNTTENVRYGTLHVDSNGAYVIFEGKFWDDLDKYYGYIFNFTNTYNFTGGFYFGCVLDMEEIGKDDSLSIQLYDSSTINLKIDDNLKNDGIYKSGNIANGTNIITWTVDYTVGSRRNLPITFTDVFNSDSIIDQVYVANSLTVTYNSGSTPIVYDVPDTELKTAPNTAPSVSGAANDTIKYTINTITDNNGDTLNTIMPGDVIKFQYKTTVTDKVYQTLGDSTINNKAEISGPSLPNTLTFPASVSVKEANKKWLFSKDYIPQLTENREITWTVRINVVNTDVSTLKFYDYIADGLKVTGASVTYPGGVAVPISWNVVDSSTIPTTPTTGLPSGVPTSGAQILICELPKDVSTNEYYQAYAVTYYTKLDESYFIDNIQVTGAGFDNTAWVDFTWPGGVTPSNPNTPSIQIEKDAVGIGTHVIQKSGLHNLSSTGDNYINWTITVNPYGIDIATGGVTDTLEDYYKYKQGSLAIVIAGKLISLPDNHFSGPDLRDFTYNFTAADIATLASNNGVTYNSTDTFTIKFTTSVDEKQYYKASQATNITGEVSKIFYNTASFNGTAIATGGVTQPVNDSAEGKTPSINSSVVHKTVYSNSSTGYGTTSSYYNNSYNYDTQTIRWRVEVNRNLIFMSNVVLEDQLGAWLKGDTAAEKTASVTVKVRTGSTLTSGTEITSGFNYAVDDFNKLTITFTDDTICNMKRLYVFIDAVVDVDKLGSLTGLNGTGVSPTASLGDNTAKLSWKTTGGGTESSNSNKVENGSITNNMIGKGHNTYTIGSETTPYDASTNQIKYSVQINPVKLKLDNCTLTDTIPSQLKLDVGSIKLWEANVSAGGALTRSNTEVTPKFEYYYGKYANGNSTADGSSTFIVEIPDTNKAYILEYACYVVTRDNDIKNTVVLKGDNVSSTMTRGDTASISIGAFATGINARQNARLEIKKINSIQGNISLSGISFELLSEYNGVKSSEGVKQTGSDGTLLFENLSVSPLVTYTIEEKPDPTERYDNATAIVTVANDSQFTSPIELKSYSFTLGNTPTTINVQITNDPTSYTVKFKKVNEDSGIIPGATFEITEDTTIYTSPRTYEATSGADGVVEFKNVYVGDIPAGTPSTPGTTKTYTLREKSPAKNYIPNDTEYGLTIDFNGNYTIKNRTDPTAPVYIYNSQTPPQQLFEVKNYYNPSSRVIKANVDFRKINDVRLTRLNGATFQITEIIPTPKPAYYPAIYEPYTDVSTSTGDDGVVMFRNVPVGQYELKEISATPYYAGNSDPFILTVNSNKTFTIVDKNNVTLYPDSVSPSDPWKLKNTYTYKPGDPLDKPIPISFNKVIKGSNTGLGGAVFQLDEYNDYHFNSPGLRNYTATSASNGRVTFENVYVGLYSLKETSAPTNYIKDNTVYMLIVYVGGTYRIVDPNGKTVYDSVSTSGYTDWKVENTYNPPPMPPIIMRRTFTIPNDGPSTPDTPVLGPSIPHPHKPGHILVTYDEGKTYIELNEDGNPIGKWSRKKNEDGYIVWTYEKYPSESKYDDKDKDEYEDEGVDESSDKNRTHPDTGDSSRVFLWILSFYTSAAVLIALLWIRKKKKLWRYRSDNSQ